MHRCGVKKNHGNNVRSLTEAIFTLPFVGKNFFRGIALNRGLPFGKDAAYELRRGRPIIGGGCCFRLAGGSSVSSTG